VFNVSEEENRCVCFSWIAALNSMGTSASCAPLYSGPDLVFQHNLKSSCRAEPPDASGVQFSTNSDEKDIDCSEQLARNRPQDLSGSESGIPVTRASDPPSTPLRRRAVGNRPLFSTFGEGVLCLGMLGDLAFQSFAGLG
jgi:hypothetical protein